MEFWAKRSKISPACTTCICNVARHFQSILWANLSKHLGFGKKKSLKSDETRFQNALKRRNCAVFHLQLLGQKSHKFFLLFCFCFQCCLRLPFRPGILPWQSGVPVSRQWSPPALNEVPGAQTLVSQGIWTLELMRAHQTWAHEPSGLMQKSYYYFYLYGTFFWTCLIKKLISYDIGMSKNAS